MHLEASLQSIFQMGLRGYKRWCEPCTISRAVLNVKDASSFLSGPEMKTYVRRGIFRVNQESLMLLKGLWYKPRGILARLTIVSYAHRGRLWSDHHGEREIPTEWIFRAPHSLIYYEWNIHPTIIWQCRCTYYRLLHLICQFFRCYYMAYLLLPFQHKIHQRSA